MSGPLDRAYKIVKARVCPNCSTPTAQLRLVALLHDDADQCLNCSAIIEPIEVDDA